MGSQRDPADAVLAFFTRHAIEPCAISAAVSGGTDSTALLLLLAELRDRGFTITAAHVNHHLRGADSDGDEAFVRDLCARLGIALDVVDGTLDPEHVRHRGIEAAARAVRYERLLAIRAQRGAAYVATAHQQDDQAETVLMRMLTRSGPAGLRGIHPIREDGLIRPLLEIRRAELEAWLAGRGIVPRHDASNDDPRFLRNRVRPLIRAAGATQHLADLAETARDQWAVLESAIDAAERTCARVEPDATHFLSLPDNAWLRAALFQRHIRRLDPEARDHDVRRIDPAQSRISITKRLELVRTVEGWSLQAPVPARTHLGIEEIAFSESVTIPRLGVTMHVRPADPRDARPAVRRCSPGHQSFVLPAGAQPAFTVRSRRPGDRFQPLGMTRPKKLKEFLIDRRIPRDGRDRLPLLCWEGEIVWIAGVEVSERFKVTDRPAGMLYEVWLEGSGADDADRSQDRTAVHQ